MEINNTREWQKIYRSFDFEPKKIFKDLKSKKNSLFSLSFFLMVMATEILFNQPFGKKINIIHNQFYKKLFKKNYEKIERVEINTFGYSLLLILNKLFKEEENLIKYAEEIIYYSTCHWSSTLKLNDKENIKKNKILIALWNSNKHLVLSYKEESKIDLIFCLYKSFELGISSKKIIKKNISVVNFAFSKAIKEFRYDVLKEFKKTF